MNISFPGPSLTLLLYHRSSTVVWRGHNLLLLVYVQLSSTASTGSLLQGCSFRCQIALDRHRITADSWFSCCRTVLQAYGCRTVHL